MKKIKSFISYLYLAVIIGSFSSCHTEAGDCFKSTGEIIKEERVVPTYKQIHTADNIHIILTNDSSGKIIVESGKNLLSEIHTVVNNGTLYITNNNSCNWVRSYKKIIRVYVGMAQVKDLFHYGYGDIESDGYLNKDTLFIHHYGNGNIHLKLLGNYLWMDMDHLGDLTLDGSVNTLIATTLNLGELKAQNFDTQTIYLISKGQGNCYLRSHGLFSASTIDGDVYYYGNPPNVGVSKKGKGSFIKVD